MVFLDVNECVVEIRSDNTLRHLLSSKLVDESYRDMTGDEDEKEKSECAVGIAKCGLRLPRHTGSGHGEHQRVQR